MTYLKLLTNQSLVGKMIGTALIAVTSFAIATTGFVMTAQATEQLINVNDRQAPIIAGSPERIQELRDLIESRLDEIAFMYFYENYPELAEAMIEEGYTNMASEYPELATYKKAVNMLAGGIASELDGSTNLIGKGFMDKFLRVNTLDTIDANGNNGLEKLSQGLESYTQNEIQKIDAQIAEEEQRIAEAEQKIAEEQQKQAEEQQKQAEEEQKIAILDNINKNLDRLK